MDGQKLQTYASLAEVISAAAIIVSLVYVGYEFRRSDVISEREADLILFEREREAHRVVIESPRMAEIIVMAETEPESLSAPDRRRYLAYAHDFYDTWEIGWYYHEDGILGDETWAEWDDWFTREARGRPLFGWVENRDQFSIGSFTEHVDEALGVR